MESRRRVNSNVIRRRYLKTVKGKTLASRQGHGNGEMLRLSLRALLALNGRRDPLGRWITTRWTGARGARFVT